MVRVVLGAALTCHRVCVLGAAWRGRVRTFEVRGGVWVGQVDLSLGGDYGRVFMRS